ncbi:rhodanese-like domain-containing protein [Thalassotalea fusca]
MIKLFTFALLLFTFITMAQNSPVITQEQLQNLQSAPASMPFVLLDVRTDDEFQQGHISGALNISHDTLSQHLALLPQDKAQPIIVYCRSGRRAAIAEELLRENGFTNVRHLQGDMKLWQANNLPIEQ